MNDRVVPFNPLDKRQLGESVGRQLLAREPCSLGQLERFQGAGIYVIYYSGDFPAYTPLAQANQEGCFEAPIYVGKAVPKGSRKGGSLEAPAGSVLYSRLGEHARSIQEASNLDLERFFVRYLVVDDIWIPLAESLLIAHFSPLWNHLIDGFGNHDPGKGRHAGLRPRWDVLHPGRAWAEKCKPRDETAEQIELEVLEHLRSMPIG
ncbi:MAG: Eco29kI family restriction endonuclease [Xanthomonadaceae bacterium]|nr:Eco29kI family restriction endonuclease [Xanthomonadaceae bacterium]